LKENQGMMIVNEFV